MDTSTAIGLRQPLAHQHVLVPAWMIIDGRDDLEPVPFVEQWCLKGKRHQHNLRATAPSRLLVDRMK
jgi:hypothetical protein